MQKMRVRRAKITTVVLLFVCGWFSMPSVKTFIADRFVSTAATAERTSHSTAKRGKFFLAFSFGDQLTWATESLLALAAVANYGGRHVVAPFVKDSLFFGTKLDDNTGTLSRYFDLKELNQKLDSYAYGSLVSWERFQKNCQHKLDVLLIFFYSQRTDHRAGNVSYSQKQLLDTKGWTPCSCKNYKMIERFEIRRIICINPEVLTSLQRLESEVLHNAPCIGISQWRGIGIGRTHFSLPSSIPSPRSVRHQVPISRDLLQIAQQFVSIQLGNNFISVHFRSEWMLRDSNQNPSYLFECAQRLKTEFQGSKIATGAKRVFLATDFGKFGSGSYIINAARKRSKKLQEVLYKILDDPETFDPDTSGLSDRGSVAIVEMNILTDGKRLFLVGGGKFEKWMDSKFEQVNNNIVVKICYHNSARR